MGTFNINITGVGGHGCDRKADVGEPLKVEPDCKCPDCRARRFVSELREAGMFNHGDAVAEFTHWPGQKDAVVDDLLTCTRKSGNFK